MIQPNTITGVILAYAGGRASVGQASAPIDQQGNFSVPVHPQPATQSIALTPPFGSPYSTLVLGVALSPGETNITAQINAALAVVGTFIGLPSVSSLATNARGFATPASGNVAVKTVSANYAAVAADETILYSGVMDGSQGITLPTTGIGIGKAYTVKVISTDTTAGALNINTSNSVEWAGNPQLYAIPTGIATGGAVTLIWDGTNWWITEYNQ